MKIFILRSLNHAYITGEMSTSLRQCIITCLPEGNKPREFLKNWRPISLLSVIYKIGSTAIANRIKKILDKIISKNQAGFVKGRFIGENTRLIYDLMHFTEKHKIPGLLMLIDFEKAFDSVSWKFLYSVLEILGFGSGFIKWIKMFNNNITASIIGTKQYLHKIHYTDSSLCSLCSNDPETMVHLFLECEISKIFWENVQTWLMRKGDVVLSLDLVDILFGKQETTGFYSPCFCLNVIYIVGKYSPSSTVFEILAFLCFAIFA